MQLLTRSLQSLRVPILALVMLAPLEGWALGDGSPIRASWYNPLLVSSGDQLDRDDWADRDPEALAAIEQPLA